MGDHRGKPTPALISQREQQESSSASSTTADAPIDETGHLQLEDHDTPTPRFMLDEGPWKRWKWVPYPVRRFGTTVVQWTRGPASPQPYKIKPLFPAVQTAPLWLLDRYLPKKSHRVWLFMLYAVCWLLAFVLVIRQGQQASEVAGYGTPTTIGCGTTYWVSGNQCGIDGNDCRPFTSSGFAFRCPASCSSYQVLNYRAVGAQEVIYAPLIIGGPPDAANDSSPVYRGDSFVCGAGIHAGIISDVKGGCGVVTLVGKQANYVASTRHGISSVGFDSYFPQSYTLQGVVCDAADVRWSLLAISVAFTTVLSLFTASPALFFFPVFIVVFWQVGMASDAPSYSAITDLFSDILGKFLPAMFCAWVIYDKMGVRRTLDGLTAQVEKTILWLGGCWVGALTNYTFDFIPIQRLTGHDLEQQPGAKAALAIVVIALTIIMVTQVWFFRQEGRLPRVLKLYGILVLGIIICLVLPDLNLRIHHYVLALLLLPGTSLQTRPSLLYQGILIGLFANGIARWGFDSILQTAAALQGDAQTNSPLPTILQPVIDFAAANASAVANATAIASEWAITFQWEASPGPEYDGISVLVNDVERFRTYFQDDDGKTSFTWTRNGSLSMPEYFRFAWMDGSSSWDYTMAGIWDAQGNWTQMASGPSKVKSRSLDGESRALLMSSS